MRRIAITGSSGYLGSRLVARLAEHRDVETVVGVDSRPPRDLPAKLRFCQRDVAAAFQEVFEEERVDTAVHLAFVVAPSRDHRRVRAVGLDGARNFLDACRTAGVEQAIYMSSAAAYGAHPDNPEPLTEASPLRPNEAFLYSRYKAAADRLFQQFAEEHPATSVTVLRGCPVIGPGGHGAVGAKVFQRVMLRVAGYDPLTQFVHEDDLVRIFVHAMERRTRGIFNTAGDGFIRYSDLAGLAKRPMAPLPYAVIAPLMEATWHARLQRSASAVGLRYIMYPWVVDNRRFAEQTGFSYCYSSEEAVRALFER